MTNRDRANKISELLTRAGINVTRVVVLGVYVHIDTFKKYDSVVREIFAQLGAQVAHLPGDAKGVHLDGSKAYRLVAKFA